jgi:isovaleryl-CoA dehydrogenase
MRLLALASFESSCDEQLQPPVFKRSSCYFCSSVKLADMVSHDLPAAVAHLQQTAETVALESLVGCAEDTDRLARWPAEQLRAIAAAELMGLHVPRNLGGHEQGLTALVAVTETLAKGCASTAMCYGMHCVASAVIAAKRTSFHEENFLRPIAEGQHVTSLALSEGGTGAHFYIPQLKMTHADGGYRLNGSKHFVTSGGEADSFVASGTTGDGDAGQFSCILLPKQARGITWLEPWQGVGMRGNSSRNVNLEDVSVSEEHLLGSEGDQIWYVFEVVAPYFSMAMAAVYLGIAQAALDAATQHIQTRRHAHSGQALSDEPLIQHKVGELWMEVERTRRLIYHGALLGDNGSPRALTPILAAKAAAGETAVKVTNEAMSLGGGLAYRENSLGARLLRDARAAHVMAPNTEMLKLWTGRAVLGLPLL